MCLSLFNLLSSDVILPFCLGETRVLGGLSHEWDIPKRARMLRTLKYPVGVIIFPVGEIGVVGSQRLERVIFWYLLGFATLRRQVEYLKAGLVGGCVAWINWVLIMIELR